MKFAVCAVVASLVPASAFVTPSSLLSRPRTAEKSSSVLKADLDPSFAGGLSGNTVEIPNFDPANYLEKADGETLKWYRAAEQKHGRICMLACLGAIAQGFVNLPDSPFQNHSCFGGLAQVWAERPLAIIQILLAISAVEVLGANVQEQTAEGGDLKWDPLGLQGTFSDEEFAAMQTRELKNGRLAMISFLGIAAQEAVTGKGVFESFTS
uniref:Plastid light harvesting protein n=1 Tax=Chromera velia CCMP2878 TaxID=1169474 RepID=A0A0G4FGI4_9ALVE|eukprot:Cvel_3281.t1-p1 / transcript=Cvel_3281.t1 / gene=Cvel_3281 / organism=Chromera_velia_CCMP2878 / gene_product=Fucoxanthin-chlorophyll a-c binding protein,, putative / transcript_product=Fucoxanthin-chlorophyll a-c binding protein,, putative / location=Cvel_scaffold129:17470-18885(+) / protein_length=209 / sequence_SO=supercontig / SO=protein_coding / is_pseudo=false